MYNIYIYNKVFFTLACIFYKKSLVQGQYHIVHCQGTHTYCICHKSTNSSFLCILSKDDNKQCRLFGLSHFDSHH